MSTTISSHVMNSIRDPFIDPPLSQSTSLNTPNPPTPTLQSPTRSSAQFLRQLRIVFLYLEYPLYRKRLPNRHHLPSPECLSIMKKLWEIAVIPSSRLRSCWQLPHSAEFHLWEPGHQTNFAQSRVSTTASTPSSNQAPPRITRRCESYTRLTRKKEQAERV
jgi:hypothetical protein